MAGAAVAWSLNIGPLPIAAATYLGMLAPAMVRERRARSRLREAEHGVVTLIEWVCALVAAGRPVETALARAASRATTSPLLDTALARAASDYTLGVPLHAIITYTTVALLMSLVLEIDGTRLIRDRVREGSIATDLMKPINLPLYFFSDGFGATGRTVTSP